MKGDNQIHYYDNKNYRIMIINIGVGKNGN